ncbi:aspartate aminotransferase family protein [Polaribacter pacificus]|uniref:Aspartate aminotransferase family protein n=1 Tax=Polaribacter pacificus TaxID=1775173 RepID=A0A917I098_9FLAO|nr:aspartate aminotransferase family protein [Polaribacter pacificus]GGG99082.1 aspartate aminotransferase family protein [Polaribacter pacificus]
MHSDFIKYQAQTSPHPLYLEVSHAKGSYVFDVEGKQYLDFVAGVSANSLGHNHPKVSQAIKDQVDQYTHVMVYGEFAQAAPVALCKLLTSTLPFDNGAVYLTNSGTEATEGAIKLAKRSTGRFEIIAAKNGYHGNTQGAMSVCGHEEKNQAFRPLVPGARFIEFNELKDLEKITKNTAAVILETIQGGAGFIAPTNDYLQKVKAKCTEVGALLILDEIQSGVGRTGTFWGFDNYKVVPDIIITGKGLGGGMPIGAFIAPTHLMNLLSKQPKLGHITTFGGHPVIAAAGLATVQEIIGSTLMQTALEKEALYRSYLKHPAIKEIRGKGLMLAVLVETPELATQIILRCFEKGLLLFWLLFEGRALRITPPLTISDQEIKDGCQLLIETLDELAS